ncbi:hypothetical protein BV25DRAFT_1818780 [Artomyces pyxidatus]|uniref:Uncharacterized protein n=1 Tax=Artomyces pyxidatus TaxID=48021 RepID=A0ACB8TIV8_9AGAM|nr:hypothetical protein BV25DRAFT_1818780 [Artomyces pyxidatus]
MLRSLESHSTHDDHLRRLLDQRTARADVQHSRFPSLSEFSDSPSVYSHARFSPRPIDRAELDANTAAFNFSIPAQYRTLAQDNRDRDRINDPSASMLDLDDDDSYSTLNSPLTTRDDSPSPEPVDPDDPDPAPRMSLLGPKMRFHSPAPWEMEHEPLQEQDEQDDDARSFVSKRGRNKGKEGFMKGFGLGPSSARGTSATRPSADSSRSGARDKKSFETTSSNVSAQNGALHALAQASMSSTSLAPSAASSSRPKFTLSRARTRTTSNSTPPPINPLPPPPSSPHGNTSSTHSSSVSPPFQPTRSNSPAPSVYSTSLSRTNTRESSRPQSPQPSTAKPDYTHPYANPDLAYDRDPDHLLAAHARSAGSRDIPLSDSNGTVPESVSTRSSSPSRSASAATINMTPDTSATSIGNSSNGDVQSLKRGNGSFQGKAISGPVLVEHTPLRTVPSSQPNSKSKNREAKPGQFPGWTDLPASPTFTLISLQEAQAQARERSRTMTGQIPSNVPFLQTEPPSRYTPEIVGRARVRSTSAGAKAKSALQNFTTASSPLGPARLDNEASLMQVGGIAAPRALRHKKSGFMRLFNGKDKPMSVSPPPDALFSIPPVPKTPKVTSTRVPVPTLSPSLLPHSAGSYFNDIVKDGDVDGDGENLSDARLRPLDRRNTPALSIVPPSEPPSSRIPVHSLSPMSALGDNRSQSTLLAESAANRVPGPSSAPPSTTAFPSLSLRPVSTIFSAHFAEHIVDAGDTPEDLAPDSGTTTSGFSPPSPQTPLRSTTPLALVAGDDPAAVIQTLQEQIVSTRKAWQHQIWELEGQVRDLRAEVDELRSKDSSGERCLLCGRSSVHVEDRDSHAPSTLGLETRSGVVNRPRARTGVGTRFGAAT